MNKKIILISLFTAKVLLSETLPVITVDANQDSSSTSISASKINRVEIENTVQGNGFISSILDTNPNITVVDDSKNSNTAGEIAPGKISINEAAYYQNNFQIDGISNDSLIDPNLSNTFDLYDVPGNENEIFLDLDLVDSIFVYDSNISAEYGGFTGGVIDVKTIRAGAKPSYKISYFHTSDNLTQFHVKDKETFEKAKSDKRQPKFEKNFYSMYINTPIDDSNGIIVSYNKKESIIPGAYFGTFVDKERKNESFFTKWSHYFEDDSVFDLSATYSPYESTHIQEYVKDSFTKIKGGGFSLKANYEKDFDFWNLRTNLGLKYSENSKDSKNYNKRWLTQNDKNWGDLVPGGNKNSTEGGSGTIDKDQKGIAYNLKLQSQEYKTGDLSHIFRTGLSLDYNKATYDRKDDMYFYTNPVSNNRIDCNGDLEGCSYSDQYFSKRRVYQAEKADADILASSIYFEDKLKYDFIEFTPGFRVDYNDYLKNTDLAYRLNSSIKPFKDDKTVIYAGLNRYYGKSFLGHKLREARAPYYNEYRDSVANTVQDWGTSTDKDSIKYIFSELDTPFTDEASIGLRQDFLGMRFNLKYINRKAKDKFSKQKGDYKIFTTPNGTKDYYRPTTFANKGHSESDIITLNVAPTKGLDFDTFSFGYKFSTSWKKTESNSDDYDDILDDEEDEDINKVYYNGKFIDKDNLPIESKPKNINLHLNFAFKPVNLFGIPTRINLNNIIRYKLSYSSIFKSNEDETVTYKETVPGTNIEKEYETDVYKDYDFANSVTFDLKTKFDFKISGKNHLLLDTEVVNLFDKVQNVQNSRSSYLTGRQFWFKASYKF